MKYVDLIYWACTIFSTLTLYLKSVHYMFNLSREISVFGKQYGWIPDLVLEWGDVVLNIVGDISTLLCSIDVISERFNRVEYIKVNFLVVINSGRIQAFLAFSDDMDCSAISNCIEGTHPMFARQFRRQSRGQILRKDNSAHCSISNFWVTRLKPIRGDQNINQSTVLTKNRIPRRLHHDIHGQVDQDDQGCNHGYHWSLANPSLVRPPFLADRPISGRLLRQWQPIIWSLLPW